jgi:reactive intermediate/imine deaminase
MARREIVTPDAPPPSGGYSQGIVAGGQLFLSGQGPFDRTGALVASSFEAQVRQVFANLEAVAAAAGTSLTDAVRVGVYLDDMATFDEMDALYREIFAEPRPARTTIETPLHGFAIEADAIIDLGG